MTLLPHAAPLCSLTLHDRLAPLRSLADGTLALIPAGVHLIQVEKQDDLILLVLLDQASFSSQLLQSMVDLRQPEALVTPSTQALLLALVWHSDPRRIYLAGFGGGRLPAVLHSRLPQAQIICTEIEPALVAIGQEFFGVALDERLQVAIADGRAYLEADLAAPAIVNAAPYDWILIDVALGNGYTPYRMGTVEFFELCRRCLAPEGVLAVNLLSVDPWFVAKLHTLQTVFPDVVVCQTPGGNGIALASLTSRSPDWLQRSAAAIAPQWQGVAPLLDHFQAVHRAADLPRVWPGLTSAPILRDATPPADYFHRLPTFPPGLDQRQADAPCPCGSGQRFRTCHGS